MPSLSHVAMAATLAAWMGVAHAGPVAGQGTWESTLHARDLNGDGVADADYDSSLNVTWLRDWGLAGNGGYWPDAVAWANALVIGGHAGWRLPSAFDLGAPGCDFATAGTDCGANNDPAASEYAHLFFVTLGNLSYDAPDSQFGDPPQPGWGLSNTAHFAGMQVRSYWTGTAATTDPLYIWTFSMSGSQHLTPTFDPDLTRLATAVHEGDIGTPTALPEPPAVALALAAIGLLGAARRWRANSNLTPTAASRGSSEPF